MRYEHARAGSRATRLILSIGLVAMLAGCGSTPLKKAEFAERTLGIGLDQANALVDAGLVTDAKTAAVLNAAQFEANDAVKQMTEQTIAGGDITANFYIDRALSAVTRFTAVIEQIRARAGRPAG